MSVYVSGGKHTQGYTLIEIMVALAVFAILATLTATSMYHAFNTRARVSAQADQLNTLQLALMVVGRDVEQIISRSVRGNDMHLFPEFVGQSQYIEFTRGGVVNPNGEEQRSTLKRIAYICSEGRLVRRSWEQMDSPERSRYQDKVLLENLKSLSSLQS